MLQEIYQKTVVVYADANGNEPYNDWLESLKDQKAKEIIRVRIRRLESGLYGDYESVGEGILELRIFFGPGYRVYFGEDEVISSFYYVAVIKAARSGTSK